MITYLFFLLFCSVGILNSAFPCSWDVAETLMLTLFSNFLVCFLKCGIQTAAEYSGVTVRHDAINFQIISSCTYSNAVFLLASGTYMLLTLSFDVIFRRNQEVINRYSNKIFFSNALIVVAYILHSILSVLHIPKYCNSAFVCNELYFPNLVSFKKLSTSFYWMSQDF